jgi:hypothetical protein
MEKGDCYVCVCVCAYRYVLVYVCVCIYVCMYVCGMCMDSDLDEDEAEDAQGGGLLRGGLMSIHSAKGGSNRQPIWKKVCVYMCVCVLHGGSLSLSLSLYKYMHTYLHTDIHIYIQLRSLRATMNVVSDNHVSELVCDLRNKYACIYTYTYIHKHTYTHIYTATQPARHDECRVRQPRLRTCMRSQK